jgi:hypothetical protein
MSTIVPKDSFKLLGDTLSALDHLSNYCTMRGVLRGLSGGYLWMRRALDSEIERIGEEGENDSSDVLLIMDQPKIIVVDGSLTENELFLIPSFSSKDYSIRQRLKLLHTGQEARVVRSRHLSPFGLDKGSSTSLGCNFVAKKSLKSLS